MRYYKDDEKRIIYSKSQLVMVVEYLEVVKLPR